MNKLAIISTIFLQYSGAYFDVKEALKMKPQLRPAFTIMKSLCEQAEDYRKKAVTLALEVVIQ